MFLFILGSSHRDSEIEFRERLSFVADEIPRALEYAYQALNPDAFFILSTCNRTELILVLNEERDDVFTQMKTWLLHYKSIPDSEVLDCFYTYKNEQAIAHLIRVACGLSSMILGESQIFGQFKLSIANTQNLFPVSGAVQQFFQHVFHYAKKVRTDTAVGEAPVSLASVSVGLAKGLFVDVAKRAVLFVGAGEMIEEMAVQMYEYDVGDIFIANRTLSNGQKLAKKIGATAIQLSEIPDVIRHVDLVISCAGSASILIDEEMVKEALLLRKHAPYFMLDLAVPRNIDPNLSRFDDVYAYSLDDLTSIIKHNTKLRESEAQKAEVIIHSAVKEIIDSLKRLDAIDTVKAMRNQAEKYRDQELLKAKKMVENGEPIELVLDHLANGLTNKLIHNPTIEVKEAGVKGQRDLLVWAAKLFGTHK
jgi:glutamyl-tRNA reductase